MAKKKQLLKKMLNEGGVIKGDDLQNRPPKYVTWNPKFVCELSPNVPWHWGLRYSECPLVADERDMDGCADCPLQAENTLDLILKRKKNEKKRNKKKSKDKSKNSNPPIVQKPVIVESGKTYVSQ